MANNVHTVDTPFEDPAAPALSPEQVIEQQNAAAAAAAAGAAPLPSEVQPVNRADGQPSWLPEKFKNPEEMAKSYTELESQRGTQTPPDPNAADPGLSISQRQQQAPDESQLSNEDFQKFADSYQANSGLTEADYKELAETYKIPKSRADRFIQGEIALADKAEGLAFAVLAADDNGDPAEISNTILNWAAANYTPEEIKAYEDALATGDMAKATPHLESLRRRYLEAEGGTTDNNLTGGGNVPGDPGPIYRSPEEWQADMRDPRYKHSSPQHDPAFVKAVVEKAERSMAKGTI